jgi:uncharacterized membrane protein
MNLYFDNPLFFILIITFPILILVGVILLKFPPKSRNGIYGYRTKQARSSDEKWGFSQPYSAIQLIKVGVFGCAIAFFTLFFKVEENTGGQLGSLIILIFACYPIYKTERAMRKKFDK